MSGLASSRSGRLAWVWGAVLALLAAPTRRRRAGGAYALLALAGTFRVYGDIISTIEGDIVGFFASIWQGVSNFFGSIFSSLADTISAAIGAPVQAIDNSFAVLESWSANFGPLAPIAVIAIVAVVLMIIILVLWLAIRLSVSEGEETLGEAEEGV